MQIRGYQTNWDLWWFIPHIMLFYKTWINYTRKINNIIMQLPAVCFWITYIYWEVNPFFLLGSRKILELNNNYAFKDWTSQANGVKRRKKFTLRRFIFGGFWRRRRSTKFRVNFGGPQIVLSISIKRWRFIWRCIVLFITPWHCPLHPLNNLVELESEAEENPAIE